MNSTSITTALGQTFKKNPKPIAWNFPMYYPSQDPHAHSAMEHIIIKCKDWDVDTDVKIFGIKFNFRRLWNLLIKMSTPFYIKSMYTHRVYIIFHPVKSNITIFTIPCGSIKHYKKQSYQ